MRAAVSTVLSRILVDVSRRVLMEDAQLTNSVEHVRSFVHAITAPAINLVEE